MSVLGISVRLLSHRRILRLLLRFALESFEPAQIGQGSSGVPAQRDQFGGDCNPNLFGGDRTNIEPDWGVNPLKQVCGDAFALQSFEDFDNLPLRSNHAHIASTGLY